MEHKRVNTMLTLAVIIESYNRDCKYFTNYFMRKVSVDCFGILFYEKFRPRKTNSKEMSSV